jgi:SNF2 family DNA or RNA helicase
MLATDLLHDYQRRAEQFICDTPKCALFLEMGLGKTVSTLGAIARLRDEFEVNKILVIAPKRVANLVWAQEAVSWEHTKHLEFSIATGTQWQRVDALEAEADIYVINRENVQWMIDRFPLPKRRGNGKKRPNELWKWDMVVIDESSSFKNPDSKRFKALKKVLGHVHRMVLLTGSPAPNGLNDLWAPTFLLDRGERLERTYGQFKDRFFHFNRYTYELTPLPHAQRCIEEKISDISISMQANDYLDLPPTVENTLYVDVPAKALAVYKELQSEFILELEELDEPLTAATAAVLSNKLLQFCNGFAYTDKSDRSKLLDLHDAKIEALHSVVDEAAGNPVLVAYNFREDRERIRKAFKRAEDISHDPDQINRWNNGEIPMLLAHPASAGHGLSLQHGSNRAIWYGLNWSLELYEQFNARLGSARQAQSGYDRPFLLTHIVAKGLIDERVLDVIRGKKTLQDALFNGLIDN